MMSVDPMNPRGSTGVRRLPLAGDVLKCRLMGLQLDPEEIFGVAVVDVGRRVLAFVGCLMTASFLGALSLGMGEAIVNLNPGDVFDWVPHFWFLFLMPCISAWGVIYIPTLLASAFRFFTSQGALLRQFLGFLGAEALLIVLAVSKFDWECLAAVIMLVGFWGGIVWLGLLLEQRSRRKAEEHFMGLAVENQSRRKGLQDEFGTEAYSEVNDGS
jgi:hypothetical protein